MTDQNVLRRARAYLGFTQREMATQLGISRRTYQRKEALIDAILTPPTVSHLEKLVKAKAWEDIRR